MTNQSSSSSDAKRAEIILGMNKTFDAGAEMTRLLLSGLYRDDVTVEELEITLTNLEMATETLRDAIDVVRGLRQ